MDAMSRSGSIVESMPTQRRALRWALWLAAGMIFGALAGFLVALGSRGPTEPGVLDANDVPTDTPRLHSADTGE